MAWSPLAGGALFDDAQSDLQEAMKEMAARHDVDITAVAVAWLLAHPAQILPVMGTNNLERIARISDALKVNMTREEWFMLYEKANGAEVP